MSYSAIIGKIKVSNHPNADRLQLGTICGNQVIVGTDVKDGDIFVYFDSDGQLSDEFAIANDLVGRTDPATGKRIGGYFGKNRRVRAQKFRGERSDGFACELSYLVKAGIPSQTVYSLREGMQFECLAGIPICNKYYTPATLRALKGGTKKKKKRNPRFPEHLNTKQFKYMAHAIPNDAIVYLTEKCHGTSARYAHVQEEKTNWFRKLFGLKPKLEYSYQVGSRRVTLDSSNDFGGGFHKGHGFRHTVMKDVLHKLRKGEIVYGEIVGYDDNGRAIMPSHSTEKLSSKQMVRDYGKEMAYQYGCLRGGCRFLVYRIAMVNEDGHRTDLSWPQVKFRCCELELEYVPDLLTNPMTTAHDEGRNKRMIHIKDIVAKQVDGPSLLDMSHIREGVVIRVESAYGVEFLKEKSFAFKLMEGIIKDNPEYIDTEEAEGEQE